MLEINDARPGIKPSLINLRALGAASLFASKEETRYYLNGVLIELDERGSTYAATDGRRLVCYRDDLEPGAKPNLLLGSFIIPTAQCKPFKFTKGDDGYGKIFRAAERLTIAYGFVDVTFAPIDGVYPNWRRVVPTAPASGALAQYQPIFIADLQKFSDALGLGLPFIAPNGEQPAPIWFPGHPEAMGILMPVRITDELGRVAPEWVRRRAAPAQEGEDQTDIEDAIDGFGTDNVESIKGRKKRGEQAAQAAV